jgi:hypothetical protein
MMMMILFSFVHVLFFFLFLLSLSMREIYTKALLLLLLTTTTKTTRVPLFDVVVDAKGDAKRDDDDDVKTNVSPSFFTLSLLFRVSDTLNMTCSIFFSPLKKYARF